MKTVHVEASKAYDILIGKGLYEGLGGRIKEQFPKAKKILLLSDETVYGLYGERVSGELSAHFSVCTFVVPAGEESKSVENYIALLETMAKDRLTRSDLLVALGGGVVGDLGGFAAASYLRGIEFVQLPTTLLAAVDSSVGGKTAVNLSAGKNLAGAFHQPSLVVLDTDCFETLSEQVLRDGCAEIIKYGILSDRALFEALFAGKDYAKSEECVARCVQIKRDYVQADEFDKGLRQCLNLGHTAAHAIEKLSNYSISHGYAVAIGTALIARGATEKGLLSAEQCASILKLLQVFGFDLHCPYTVEEMIDVMLSDKKRAGDQVMLVIPFEIGRCELVKVPVEALGGYFKM
ncbi:MAG: 3-dehydroquinate synthase [Clostridia bacterium]|nr:3-dehydroquinate synthase [Clostridia bacterium]